MESSIQREEQVFSAAQEISDRAEREAFLDRACAGDDELRAAVEESLAACAEADRFFTRSGEALVAAGEAIGLGSAVEDLPALLDRVLRVRAASEDA